MGWFLSGSNGRPKKSKTRKTAKTAKPAKAWDPRRTLAALQVLAAGGLLLGLVVGWRHAQEALIRYVKAHQVQTISTDQVSLVGKPLWMSRKLEKDLAATAAAQISSDPLDNTGLQRVVQVLGANPWVKRVNRIQRLTGGQVKVYAQYREPTAMVVNEDGCRLVDGEGFRLPGLWDRAQAEKIGMPMIAGVSSSPGREGELWPGSDLQAGLSLVQLLQGEPYLSQIESFNVSQRDARGRIRLVLKTKSGMVRWGLPPGQEQTIEPDAATKKQWLATVYKRRGQIDAGGKVVDVYGAAVFVHQPEGEEPDLAVGYTWSR